MKSGSVKYGANMSKSAKNSSEDAPVAPTHSIGREIRVRVSSVPCPDLYRRLNQIYIMALARYREVKASKGENGNG